MKRHRVIEVRSMTTEVTCSTTIDGIPAGSEEEARLKAERALIRPKLSECFLP